MKRINTEIIKYSLNTVLVLIIFFASLSRLNNAGDKSIIIYYAWIVLTIYLVVLTLTFAKALKNKPKKYLAFNIISVLPIIYLIPLFIGHFSIIISNEVVSAENYMIISGSAIWLIITIINMFKK